MHTSNPSGLIGFTRIRVNDGEEVSSVGYFTSDSEQDIDGEEYPDGDFDFDTETDAEEYFDSFLQTDSDDEEEDSEGFTNTITNTENTIHNDKKLVFKGKSNT